MGDKGKTTPLRNWKMQSYGIENGRAISSLESAGNMGNYAKGKGLQMPSGIESLNKSGSADTGRRKMGGSDV